MASPTLFQASKGSEHSTERAELRGKRLLIAEESRWNAWRIFLGRRPHA